MDISLPKSFSFSSLMDIDKLELDHRFSHTTLGFSSLMDIDKLEHIEALRNQIHVF